MVDQELIKKLSRLPDRFRNKIVVVNECWVWIAGIHTSGYGQYSIRSKHIRAHRYSYEFFNESIQTGLVIDHLCRNRRCVNPNHLEPVTHRENLLRSPITNSGKTHCKRGHELSGNNTRASKNGSRYCLPCHKMLNRRAYLKKKSKVLRRSCYD